MKISEIGEQELIKRIAGITARDNSSLVLGIGDDAAVTVVRPGFHLVTTKDMLVEGVHFLLQGQSARALGYKSLAVNLSDLAAMGALPRHAFVGLALPMDTSLAFVLDLYRGMKELADRFDVTICGGDTVRSPGPVVISITVQGEVEEGKALLRSGAKPGDIICTTGPLGASAAGLLLLLSEDRKGLGQDVHEAALNAHFFPVPRVREAMFLAASGAVRAAIDLSDGLLKDLQEICEQSRCGAEIYEDRVPVHGAAAVIGRAFGKNPLDLALSGGEDYELLLCVDPAGWDALASSFYEEFRLELLSLGRITGGRGIVMQTRDGGREIITFKGFQHFGK